MVRGIIFNEILIKYEFTELLRDRLNVLLSLYLRLTVWG